jgi:hypothetical protein
MAAAATAAAAAAAAVAAATYNMIHLDLHDYFDEGPSDFERYCGKFAMTMEKPVARMSLYLFFLL